MIRKFCDHCLSDESTSGTKCYRCGAKFKIHRDNFDPKSHTIESRDILRYMRNRVTEPQKRAIMMLFERGLHWRFSSYLKFRRNFKKYSDGMIGGNLPNMKLFIGIEPDGYTHS